jgi:hypothetical protein
VTAFWLNSGLLPLAAVQHLAQVLHGVPHVFKADVQRREAKAQDVVRRRFPPRRTRKSPITPRAISACTMA